MNGRVLMVVNADWYFLSHRVPLAQALARAGAEVIVAAAPEAGRGHEIEALGLPFQPLDLRRRSMNAFRELGFLKALVTLYRRVSPDLVYHLTTKPVLYGSLAARLAAVPAVVNALPGLGYLFGGRGVKGALRRTAALAAYRLCLSAGDGHLILQNADDVDLFVGRGVVAADRVALIKGSGVDLEAFRPSPEPDGIVTVLFAARLLWDKGVGEFVEAARLLAGWGVPVRMVIAGEPDQGNPGHVPRAKLLEWQREGVVEWLGHVPDMAALLARCHVVVLPSYYREGVPRVLLEAGACARPMVAADAPGSREIVRHEETGLLVPPRQSEPLALAIRRLADDPRLRCDFGLRARVVVEREFDQAAVVQRTLAIVEASLAAAGRRRHRRVHDRSTLQGSGDHE